MARRSWIFGAALFVGAGCSQQDTDVPPIGPGTGVGLPTFPTFTGAPSTGTPTGTSTGSTTVDLCEFPPPAPAVWTELPNIPNSEEFAFSDSGTVLNIDDSANLLYESGYSGAPTIVAPYNSAEVGAVRFLADGSALVIADEGNGSLVKMTLDGNTSVLLGSIPEPNSIAIHSDGWVYTTAADQIWKVDPVSGQSSMQFTLPGTDLDGLVLNVDESFLFFNHDEDGVVGRAQVQPNGDLASPTVIGNIIQGFAELDGMAVDECNNIYVVITDGRVIRLRPSGAYETYVDLGAGGAFTTSLHFGSGLGGFKTDHLYVMDRFGAVIELDVGLHGRGEPHLPPFPTSGGTATGTP